MFSMIFVGLGGFIGATSRYAISQAPFTKKYRFPMATFFVNVVGSLMLGFLFNISTQYNFINSNAMLLLGTGIMGSFTTFSTFSVESITMIKTGKTLTAMLYVLFSFTLSLLSAFLGFGLAYLLFNY